MSSQSQGQQTWLTDRTSMDSGKKKLQALNMSQHVSLTHIEAYFLDENFTLPRPSYDKKFLRGPKAKKIKHHPKRRLNQRSTVGRKHQQDLRKHLLRQSVDLCCPRCSSPCDSVEAKHLGGAAWWTRPGNNRKQKEG